MDHDTATIAMALNRIAKAVERLSPATGDTVNIDALETVPAFLWQTRPDALQPVPLVAGIDLPLLHGIDQQRDTLLANTWRFARNLPANNALLWGARGMGKSSLVKAVHAHVNQHRDDDAPMLALIEIHREDIASLPRLLGQIRRNHRRCIVFCDDLSFDKSESNYKSLKAILEGGIEGRPDNVLFYATSNRRHLMPRDMIQNEAATAINPGEAVEESVSLSDRFGLWLGFHACDQETFFAMVRGYADELELHIPDERLRAEAHEWAITRGARSGRVAWQFIQDLAGRLWLEDQPAETGGGKRRKTARQKKSKG